LYHALELVRIYAVAHDLLAVDVEHGDVVLVRPPPTCRIGEIAIADVEELESEGVADATLDLGDVLLGGMAERAFCGRAPFQMLVSRGDRLAHPDHPRTASDADGHY
jgi:hypothetical protein